MRKVVRGTILGALLLSATAILWAHVEGRMTGGGSFFVGGVRVTHGFELHCGPNEVPPGTGFREPNNLEINWGGGNNFHLEQLLFGVCSTDAGFSPNPPNAGFTTYDGAGWGKFNNVDGAYANWRFTDYGEPGNNDLVVTLRIVAADGTIVLDVTSPVTLTFGNHQAHAN
jgi:hypothetical protein